MATTLGHGLLSLNKCSNTSSLFLRHDRFQCKTESSFLLICKTGVDTAEILLILFDDKLLLVYDVYLAP